MRRVVCAVDIGATKFEVGLVGEGGELLDRSRCEVDHDVGPQSHFSALAALVGEQLERARDQHHANPVAIGVGCAGPIERDCETVSPVNITAWKRFPLRAHLHELTGIDVYGDLDAKALAVAEGWLGAGRGIRDFCMMTVSTGVGGALVIDGQVLDGDSGNAGHIGHLIVVPDGRRCGCGARGCLEAEASGRAVEAITGRSPRQPTYEIMQRTGTLVGRAAASICNVADLDLVVVGGAVALGFGATFLNAAQVELDERARVGVGVAPRIVQTRLADRGPLIGAAAIAWQALGVEVGPRVARVV